MYYAPDNSSTAGIILANSPIPCKLTDSDDPSEILFEQRMIEAAFTREDSFTLWMELVRPQNEPFVGNYIATAPETSNGEPPATEPRSVLSFFRLVTEASVAQYDGMLRRFQADEIEALYLTEGFLEITEINPNRIHGDLNMAEGSYTGSFNATACDDPEVLQILGFMFEGIF